MIIISKNPSGGLIVPEGTILYWDQPTIPDGWAQFDLITGRMIKGAAAVNLTPQGSWTHQHANPNTGSVGDHAHGGSHRAASGSVGTVGQRGTASSTGSSIRGHTHNFTNVSTSNAGGHSHGMGNTHFASHYPPFRKVFAIKAFENAHLPLGAILMFKKQFSLRPAGFNLCDGLVHDGVSTPNMVGRFPYGAESAGELGVSGGALTHSHGQPNTNSDGGHSHSVSCGTNTVNANVNVYALGAGAVDAIGSHSHSVGSFSTSNDPNHSHSVPETGTASNMPPYLKLYYLMMTTNLIMEFMPGCVLFMDNANNIPGGWSIIGNGRYILGAENDSDLEEEGGSLGHTHTQGATSTRSNHNHDGFAHTGGLHHNGSTFNVYQFDPGTDVAVGHGHSGGQVNIDGAGAHSHSMSNTHSANREPEHISLIMIEKD